MDKAEKIKAAKKKVEFLEKNLLNSIVCQNTNDDVDIFLVSI